MEMKRGRPATPQANEPTTGTIKSLDAGAHTVTLETGTVCHCENNVDLTRFKSGDKVNMTFAEKNGKSECCEMTRAA